MDIIPIMTQFIHYLLQELLHPSLLQVVLSAFFQAMSTLDFMMLNRVVIFGCRGEEGSPLWKPWVMQSSHNLGPTRTEWHGCPLTKQWWRPRVAKMWTSSANDRVHLHSTQFTRILSFLQYLHINETIYSYHTPSNLRCNLKLHKSWLLNHHYLFILWQAFFLTSFFPAE